MRIKAWRLLEVGAMVTPDVFSLFSLFLFFFLSFFFTSDVAEASLVIFPELLDTGSDRLLVGSRVGSRVGTR